VTGSARRAWALAAAALAGTLWAASGRLEIAEDYVRTRMLRREKTVAQRLEQYGPAARARLEPDFARAGVAYPPASVELVVFKRERALEVYAAGADGRLKFVRRYAVLAASGGPGPKLREGDGQVPEGIYPITELNPNSLFHLSLRVGYPNDFDRAHARADGRERLGGDIMIHGNAVSIGCVAIGDEGAEDLFVLAAQTGAPHLRAVIAPHDLRAEPAPAGRGLPKWTPELYKTIKAALAALPPARG
jgi:hypothetical protein